MWQRQPIPPPAGFFQQPTMDVTQRQQIIQNYPIGAREVDVDGNYHPKEFLRKLSRYFTMMQYNVTSESGDMIKSPVGQQTGEFHGNIQANASFPINPAGTFNYNDYTIIWLLLIVFTIIGILTGIYTYGVGLAIMLILFFLIFIMYGNQLCNRTVPFSGRLDLYLQAHLDGEIYEDFRSGASGKMPVSSNLSLILGGRIEPITNRLGLKEEQFLMSGRGKMLNSAEWFQAIDYFTSKVRIDINELAEKAEAVRMELSSR